MEIPGQGLDASGRQEQVSEDIIDLQTIDADTGSSGDQAFHLVGAFTGDAGEMTIAYNSATDFTSLLMDVNEDAAADMRIILNGDHDGFMRIFF